MPDADFDPFAIAARILAGEGTSLDYFNAIRGSRLVPIDEDTAYVATRGVVGNVGVFRTRRGLVLTDTGSAQFAGDVRKAIRAWTDAPVHTIVLTHGHQDHVRGVPLYDAEADRAGRARPRLVAHANVPRRFERYVATRGLNERINARQFTTTRRGIQGTWPRRYRPVDRTYEDALTLKVGGRTFELFHGRGETDDHTWAFLPDRRILVSGDFVIWAAPNAGNPQKVQRYAGDWARALRAMAAHRPAVLIPGHGPGVRGVTRVRELLRRTAEYLELIHDQTVERMNRGEPLNHVVHEVKVPERLARLPYLRATYDDPEFLVRNVWRLYGGWYDGNPAHLKPARDAELAGELVKLAGGADALAARASELARGGDLRLAAHLAELAFQAAPESRAANEARAEVYTERARAETSLMARGIFSDAAAESRARLAPSGTS